MLVLNSSVNSEIHFNIDYVEFRVDFNEKFVNDLDGGYIRLNSLVNEVDPFFDFNNNNKILSGDFIDMKVVQISPSILYRVRDLIEISIMDKKVIPNVGVIHRIILKIVNKNLYNRDGFIEAVSLVNNIIVEYDLMNVELYKMDFNMDFNGFNRASIDDNKFRLGRYIEGDKKLEFRLDGGTIYVNKKSYKGKWPAVSRLYNKSAELKSKPYKLYQVKDFNNREDIFRLELILDRKFQIVEDKILLNVLGEFLLNRSVEDLLNNKIELICWVFNGWQSRYKISDVKSGRSIFSLDKIKDLVNVEEVAPGKWMLDFINEYNGSNSEYKMELKSKKKIKYKVDLEIKLDEYKKWLEDFSGSVGDELVQIMFNNNEFVNKLWIRLGDEFYINEFNIMDLSNRRLKLDASSKLVHNFILNRFIEKYNNNEFILDKSFKDNDLEDLF